MKELLPETEQNDFIRLDSVTKVYQQGKIRVLALNELNLTIKQGNVIVIFGPSGSGKTTLLNLVGGLDELSSGTLMVGDLPIHDLSPEELDDYRREQVGFIFQNLNLYPSLTVMENVFHQGRLVSDETEDALLTRVETLLETLGISDRKDHMPDALSGGEQQRVAIGMALIKNPSIVIADEPTGELDATNAQKIINLFGEIKKNFPMTTFLVVSHNYAWQEIADHVYYLENGKIKRQIGLSPQGKSNPEEEFSEIPHLINALQCPQCSSFNVQFILRRPNKLEMGTKYAVINGIIMCNDCSSNNPVSAKISKGNE